MDVEIESEKLEIYNYFFFSYFYWFNFLRNYIVNVHAFQPRILVLSLIK